MDWVPAISTTTAFTIIVWLLRKVLMARITNAISHEYNKKLEKLKTDLRKNEETFKAEIKTKESQIEALRSGVLTAVSNRQSQMFTKQLESIEKLWDVVVLLAPAKNISATMAVINFEAAAREAEKNQNARDMFASLSNIDVAKLPINEASKLRPFISKIAWAYYSAYQAIVIHAVIRMHMLKSGINMPEIIDSENVTKLVNLALPHQSEYIKKHGANAFHYLLEELETKLLYSFDLTIKGEESDKETLNNAAAIIKQSEVLMESKPPNETTK